MLLASKYKNGLKECSIIICDKCGTAFQKSLGNREYSIIKCPNCGKREVLFNLNSEMYLLSYSEYRGLRDASGDRVKTGINIEKHIVMGNARREVKRAKSININRTKKRI